MATTVEAKNPKQAPSLEDKESLVEYAKTVSHERARVEAKRLDEQITARQALLESVKPEHQARLVEQMSRIQNIVTTDVASTDARTVHLPPPTCISYQVLRPPFPATWFAHPLRTPTGPFHLTTSCVSIVTHQSLGLTAVSAEGILSEGAISIQAAIGDFFNARCQNIGTWFIGEGNRAYAGIGSLDNVGPPLPSPGYLSVEADLAMEGPVGWSNFMFPGDPGSGLGLVGFIGIGSMIVQTFDGPQKTLQETTDRFLLGSASATFPGSVDRKPTFTLRSMTFLPATSSSALRYTFLINGDLTAFRSTPIEHGGFPGFAHANLTTRDTPGPLQPGTPLKVKEIRVAICTWP